MDHDFRFPPNESTFSRQFHFGRIEQFVARIIATCKRRDKSEMPAANKVIRQITMAVLIANRSGLTISEGALCNMLARAEAPLTWAAAAITDAVRSSKVVASDETSARVWAKPGGNEC